MFPPETVKHLCQMMARYRAFVFVSFLFLSSVIKFDKKCANSTQRLAIAQLLRLTIVSAKSKIYSPRRGYSNFIIHQRHNFLPILALILLKLTHASNRPVYFRDLCAAYSALPQKSSLIIFQHTYANLLSWKITQHDKISQNVEISQKSFQAKNLLKQTTYLLLEAKNPSYFNSVRANETHNRCHKTYAIK